MYGTAPSVSVAPNRLSLTSARKRETCRNARSAIAACVRLSSTMLGMRPIASAISSVMPAPSIPRWGEFAAPRKVHDASARDRPARIHAAGADVKPVQAPQPGQRAKILVVQQHRAGAVGAESHPRIQMPGPEQLGCLSNDGTCR